MEFIALPVDYLIDLFSAFFRQRFKRSYATTFDDIEAQSIPDKVKVFYNFASPIYSLRHDTGECFSKKTRAMKNESQPVKEYFHYCGYLEGVIGRCEYDSV